MEAFDRAHYVTALEIDEDDIDHCLVDQPGLFFHVSEAVAIANSLRDGTKLALKELRAEIDQEIRETANRQKEKIREDDITAQVTLDPEVQKLERELLNRTTAAEKALALKESYQQRSYALKDKVSLELGRLYQLGIERGSRGARNRLGERLEAKLQEQQKEQRQAPRRGRT